MQEVGGSIPPGSTNEITPLLVRKISALLIFCSQLTRLACG